MKKTERRFRDGDVIFREKDASNSLLTVVEGNVELRKSGERGPVMLAMLGPGEMFGEMGLVEGGRRNAIAIAIGAVVVEEVERKTFLAALEKNPKLAQTVMANMAERLSQANDRLSHPSTALERTPTRGRGFSLVNMFRKLASAGGGGGRIEIRVFPFHAEFPETAEEQMRHVVRSLGKRSGIRARPMTKIPEIDEDLHPDDRLMKLREYAVEGMAGGQGDLAVFGHVPPPGRTLHLHFFSLVPDDPDRPGSSLPGTVLTLPVDFGPELAELLLAVALSATALHDEGKSIRLGQAVSEALYAAMPAVQNLPQDMSAGEKASVQMCYGHAVATLAFIRGTTELYQVAVQTYRAALEQLSREDNRADWALTQKHLGAALQVVGERNGDTEALQAAADAFQAALEVFRRDRDPLHWASAQNRLGVVLYRLDLKTGDQETLKESLAAYQAALQVYTRGDHPARWAEVMNNFAQAAQILGEQLHSAEALERAVDACRKALEVRRRDKGPLLWAATQNNLGSALFLLGKLTRGERQLEDAAAAFSRALEAYVEFNVERLAAVARKNLARVHEELKDVISEVGYTDEPKVKFDWDQVKSKRPATP